MPGVLMTDDQHPPEPDRQIQDDLSNWGVPSTQPPEPAYFPHDEFISYDDVPEKPREQENYED